MFGTPLPVTINAAIADGALPIGDDGLPRCTGILLAETAEAHAAVEADIVGKVLIDMDASDRQTFSG
jgi:NADPH2:quinone reductase